MNTRKKYPKEFKLDAVSLILDQSYMRIPAQSEHPFWSKMNTDSGFK